jgi:hypothetical protein
MLMMLILIITNQVVIVEPTEPDEVYQSKIDFASIKNKATRARLRREEAEAKDKFRREKREKRKRERDEAGDGPVRCARHVVASCWVP